MTIKNTTMNNTITKSNIAKHIQENLGFSKNLSDALVSEIFSALTQIVAMDSKIKIPNFGTFTMHKKDARPGVNLHNKTKMIIAPREVVRFIPSRTLKRRMNNHLA